MSAVAMTAGIEAVNRQSFIVRIWLERLDEEPEAIEWRGQITHVGTGDNRYVRDLEELVEFIAKYVAQVR